MTTFTSRIAGILSASALAAGLAVVSQSALAQATGITTSPHDLRADQASTTEQICVFCHTPHGADTAFAGVPLWNRALDPLADYGFYNSSTLDSDTSGGPGGVSRACLSCHDGVQALDALLNMPGGLEGGNDVPTGTRANMVDGTIRDLIGPTPGTDGLENDHPIGMNYCAAAQNADVVTDTSACADAYFNAGSTNGARVFIEAASNTPDSIFQKSDLPLYKNTDAGDTVGLRVECATCHDPHQGDRNVSLTFLRVTAAGSEICLTCHVK